MDLSIFNRPEVLEIIFPVVYSPYYATDYLGTSTQVPTLSIEVEPEVSISCGFWVSDKADPTVLLFHGNGETAIGYNWIAPLYVNYGLNLLIAEYRGYGLSEGKPTVANMLSDAHVIFKYIRKFLEQGGFTADLFIAGRSLGSLPALELAFHYEADINGLIIESGTANNFPRLWKTLGITEEEVNSIEDPFLNKVKIRQVHKATLIIHGQRDMIIPVREGEELYQNSGAYDKKISILPEAGHNDIISVYKELYFSTVGKFVNKHS